MDVYPYKSIRKIIQLFFMLYLLELTLIANLQMKRVRYTIFTRDIALKIHINSILSYD